ncbi:hypothetical protein QUF76_00425 [Desulfobacterales bacterium HSG16]|nr:hypothetical protein [Desulfobacterales bacterium HSG16]
MEKAKKIEKNEETKTPVVKSSFHAVETVKKAAQTCTDAFTEYKGAFKDYSETVKEHNKKYLKDAVETGKELGKNLRKDACEILDQAKEKSRNILPEIPEISKLSVVKTVEEKITDGIDVVTGKFNLPKKEDMKKLDDAMDSLNSRMDLFTQQITA